MHRKDIEWQRYNISLADGGPFYAETNTNNFFVEPWNAASSLFFLIPAIYWAIKIRHSIKENLFIAYCIPLLVVGGLGSTLFHAFRSSSVLLYMDVLPIQLLTFSVSTYFWQKTFKNWWLTIVALFLLFLVRQATFTLDLPIHTITNITYGVNGIIIFLPIVIVLIKTNFYRSTAVLSSLILFSAALFFREIDARGFDSLPMGTHFLWHILSAGGAYFLAKYLYFMRRAESKTLRNAARKQKSIEQLSETRKVNTCEVV